MNVLLLDRAVGIGFDGRQDSGSFSASVSHRLMR